MVTVADKLTNKYTAFRTFAEFVEAMRGGYVPTIYGTEPGKVRLTRIVRAAGFKVYDGAGVK